MPVGENDQSDRSVESRLQRLKNLEERGLVTKDEAAQRRKVILDDL